MNDGLSLSRVADLSAHEQASVKALALAVYPPEDWSDWPGQSLEWADPEWCVRVHDDNGMLASYTGIVIRRVIVNGASVHIGGVGGIKTHPAARGRGYARRGIEVALRFFAEHPDVGFALLVCEPHLLPYYSASGWSEFNGRLLVRQRGAVSGFTLNRVMTHAVRADGPASGTIDLCGPPW